MSTSRAQPAQPETLPDKHTGHATPVAFTPLIGEASYKRLNLHHETHKRILGGLYGPREPIEAALAPKEGCITRVVDVGTGSGIWAVEMAERFPHSEVVGIDLHLPTLTQSQPPNLLFQVVDINLPLPGKTANVDFVYARQMDYPITNYPRWLSEVSRILCPGGVYYAFSPALKAIKEDGTELPTVPIGEEGYTGFQSYFSALYNIFSPRWNGGPPHDRWTTWMEENGNFSKIVRDKDVLEPVGPWQKDLDENTRIGSELMREGILSIISDCKPVLLASGHDEALVSRWIEDATVELSELRIHVFTVWSSAWCVRSDEEWKPFGDQSLE